MAGQRHGTAWLQRRALGDLQAGAGPGGQVRRGEKGSAILFWQFETRKLARDRKGQPIFDQEGKPVYETTPLDRPRSYPYTVFNAEQCNGLPRREPPAGAHSWNPIEEAERALARTGATIENSGDNRAYYDLRRDRIILPYKEQFPAGPGYYQTALHELGHWTGHPQRLNRATLLTGIEEGFASPHYAREELRAEISSIMTGAGSGSATTRRDTPPMWARGSRRCGMTREKFTGRRRTRRK